MCKINTIELKKSFKLSLIILSYSPVKSRSDVEQFDPNFDPRVIKRAQKIQKVHQRTLREAFCLSCRVHDSAASLVEYLPTPYSILVQDTKVPGVLANTHVLKAPS